MGAATSLREELYFRRSLFNEPAASVVRLPLSNPPRRLEIRPDFPRVLNYFYDEPDSFKPVLDRELRKHGTSLDRVRQITLAYPHKHPDLYPDHVNNAERGVGRFKKTVEAAIPHIRWVVAGGLCETVHLARSENQSSVHALTGRQVYAVHRPSQESPCPLLERKGDGKDFFIVVDSGIEQGTTIANLVSYITHNGGVVLAAAATEGCALAQQGLLLTEDVLSLSSRFNDKSRNTKCLPRLAKAFSGSAKENGKNWSPETCLEMFEDKLNGCGNSVFSLTHGECGRLVDAMRGKDAAYRDTFPALLKKLQKSAAGKSCSR